MSDFKKDEVIDLENKKVKIKYKQIMGRKDNYSQKYIDFINENKDVIFTVKLDKKYPNGGLYTFVEDDTWLFWEEDLEVVEYMYYYQIYWSDGYEEETGSLLSHNSKFSQQEFDEIVQTAKRRTGGFNTFLENIEEYVILNYGFKRVDIVKANTMK